MEKSDFYELIREGPFKGQYLILIDKINRWGPIISREKAEELWSKFKNSNKTFEKFIEDNC